MNRKLFLLLFLPIALLAAEKETKKMEASTIGGALSSNARSIMMIDPQARAQDFIRSYETLKMDISPSKIFIVFSGREKISNVSNIKLMENGTLLVFLIHSSEGNKNVIVPIEDIVEIYHE